MPKDRYPENLFWRWRAMPEGAAIVRGFFSEDKRHRILIWQREDGTYSYLDQALTFDEYEQEYWWQGTDNRLSFYENEESVLSDIAPLLAEMQEYKREDGAVKEIDPQKTKRAEPFALWMNAPMPMVTLCRTLNVTPLVRMERRQGFPFNMLLCWCIGKAAAMTEAFFLLPVQGKLMQFERLAVNVVVRTAEDGIATCDIPWEKDMRLFDAEYRRRTAEVSATGKPLELGEEYMVIGTSALVDSEIDCAVNLYAGIYNNPFLIWGKYRRHFGKVTLPLSFQFHHVQMDGNHAAQFLNRLQDTIDHVNEGATHIG